MTHDELLDKIAQEGLKPDGNILNTKLILAFRAVVELHKPYESTDMGLVCAFCKDMNSVEYWYPCPTIQAIEKELN